MTKQEAILLLFAALFAIVSIAAWFFVDKTTQQKTEVAQEDTLQQEQTTIGPPNQATLDKLAKSDGFQHLVSYTENSFEPKEIKIKKGETIRFTNNSQHDLLVIKSTKENIFGKKEPLPCNNETLNSCKELTPRDFWEFTFTETGTFEYVNEVNELHNGVVYVE